MGWDGFINYAVEMGSGAMIYIPSFKIRKVGQRIHASCCFRTAFKYHYYEKAGRHITVTSGFTVTV
jgi:hypothetical protein